MAATLNRVGNYAVGDQMCVVTDVIADGAYSAGGYAVTPAQLGFADLSGAMIDSQPTAAGGSAVYDAPNAKVKIFTAGAEAGAAVAGVTANGVVHRVSVTGKYAL